MWVSVSPTRAGVAGGVSSVTASAGVLVIPVYGQKGDWGEDRVGLSDMLHQAGDSSGAATGSVTP